MKRGIAIALIILAVYLAFTGISKFSNSKTSVDVVGIEITAEDKQGTETSFLFLGLAILSGLGGFYLLKNNK